MARIRESQTQTPLTPSFYRDPTPPPTPTAVSAPQPAPILCPNCGTPLPFDPTKVAERVAVDGAIMAVRIDLNLDIKALERKVEALQRERDDAKRVLAEERGQHTEECRRMRSENERLKVDLQAAYTRAREAVAVTATDHKKELFEAVRDGKFCSNAAAPPEEIKAEAAAKIEEMENKQ